MTVFTPNGGSIQMEDRATNVDIFFNKRIGVVEADQMPCQGQSRFGEVVGVHRVPNRVFPSV